MATAQAETKTIELEDVVETTAARAKTEWTYTPFGESEPITLTMERAKNFLANPTKSGVLPSTRDLIEFLQVCETMKLNPWIKDAYLVGYDSKDGAKFSVITAYKALAKRAEHNREYDGIEAGAIVKRDGEIIEVVGAFGQDGDVLLGAWCRVHRKDRSVPVEVRIKKTEYAKSSPFWKDMPYTMIVKCSRAAAMREAFPSDLGGLFIAEEMKLDDVIAETNRRKKSNAGKSLNDIFGEPDPPKEEPVTSEEKSDFDPTVAIEWEHGAEFESAIAEARTRATVLAVREHFLDGAVCKTEEKADYVSSKCDEKLASIGDETPAKDLFDKSHQSGQ